MDTILLQAIDQSKSQPKGFVLDSGKGFAVIDAWCLDVGSALSCCVHVEFCSIEASEVVDFAEVDSPLLFIHGIGQTIEAFDDQLNGLKVGDTFDFGVEAAVGYGIFDPTLVVDLPKTIFEGEDIPEDILEIDAVLPLQDSEGNPLDGRVVEIGEDTVKVDLNHPLAGEDLHFKGEILSVRLATEEELEHGHVHGEGGHHH